MKTLLAAAAALALIASQAQAQPAPAPAPAVASAASAASAKLSVQTSKVDDIIKNEKAKAALEKVLPEISAYYSQIGGMTLAEIAPMSQGALDDAKLKTIQEEFDKLS